MRTSSSVIAPSAASRAGRSSKRPTALLSSSASFGACGRSRPPGPRARGVASAPSPSSRAPPPPPPCDPGAWRSRRACRQVLVRCEGMFFRSDASYGVSAKSVSTSLYTYTARRQGRSLSGNSRETPFSPGCSEFSSSGDVWQRRQAAAPPPRCRAFQGADAEEVCPEVKLPPSDQQRPRDVLLDHLSHKRRRRHW